MNIREEVYNFKTKYPQGFVRSEIDEIISKFEGLNMDKFYNALMGITCMVSPEKETIIYHCDIEKALHCGVENRNLYLHEWD